MVDISGGDSVNYSALSFFHSVNGEPAGNVKFIALVEGTPFFRDYWMSALVTLPGTRKFANIQVKLNLLDNNIHFTDVKGNEMVTSAVVHELYLVDTVEAGSYSLISSNVLSPGATSKTRWFLVLEKGTATLLKEVSKKIKETKPYGSATTEQRIETGYRYYILSNNNLFQIKKLRSITEALPDRRKELKQFISHNHLQEKNEQHWISVINYYNQLAGQSK
ncbi:MAG: hypothetical protein SFU87_07300 [Chitinophagaceae bacterium]|nr:hypothetical protein [Chitinophagaceae bacterium]